MPEKSAGLLLFRRTPSGPEILLVHPGGPFWANKDVGAWSIPKGLYEDPEDPLDAARREFREETGFAPQGPFNSLGVFRLPSGKRLAVWSVEGDLDLARFESNRFAQEWPPKSGRYQEFPEADRAGWFAPQEAMRKVTRGQVPVVAAFLAQWEHPDLIR